MDALFLGIPCLLEVVGVRATLDSRKIEPGAFLSLSCPYARFFAVDALGQVEIRPYGCDCGQNMLRLCEKAGLISATRFLLLGNGGTIRMEILIFHHVMGRTKGMERFAGALRQAGHTVHLPDLFEGQTFATIDNGLAYVKKLGFDQVAKRGVESAQGLPREIVYVGFSLGVSVAQELAQTRDGARGAVFIDGCMRTAEFDSPWPMDLPAQIHAMDADPYFVAEGDLQAARELVDTAGRVKLFLYPGAQHLFVDSSLPSYHAESASLVLRRILNFLRHLED